MTLWSKELIEIIGTKNLYLSENQIPHPPSNPPSPQETHRAGGGTGPLWAAVGGRTTGTRCAHWNPLLKGRPPGTGQPAPCSSKNIAQPTSGKKKIMNCNLNIRLVKLRAMHGNHVLMCEDLCVYFLLQVKLITIRNYISRWNRRNDRWKHFANNLQQ